MKHQRHFESSSAALKETVQIRKLMSDLARIVRILNCDIATEEEHARTFDRSDPAYSMLASALSARRDNLKDTIAALGPRLARLEEPVLELT